MNKIINKSLLTRDKFIPELLTGTFIYSVFEPFEYEIDKLDMNRLINVPISFNNLKTRVNDLDVAKLRLFLQI